MVLYGPNAPIRARLYSTSDVAPVLGVTPKTLRAMIRRGAIVEVPGVGFRWSAEGAVLLCVEARVPVPKDWIDALTPGQRTMVAAQVGPDRARAMGLDERAA